MDALTYFLLNYGLYSLLLVVPAALLGVAYGWFRWGKHQAGVKELRKRMEDAEGIVGTFGQNLFDLLIVSEDIRGEFCGEHVKIYVALDRSHGGRIKIVRHDRMDSLGR